MADEPKSTAADELVAAGKTLRAALMAAPAPLPDATPAKPAVNAMHRHVQAVGIGGLMTVLVTLLGPLMSRDFPPLAFLYMAGGLSALSIVCYTCITCVHLRCEAAKQLGKTVLCVLCAFAVPFLSGCATHAEQNAELAALQKELIAHEKDSHAIYEKFLTDYRTRMQAEADKTAQAAIVKEIGPDGKANAANVQVIQKIRLAQYAAIEKQISAMRAKIAESDLNAANAMQRLDALTGYLTQSGNSSQMLNQTSDQMVLLLEKFLDLPQPQAPIILPSK